MSLLKVFNTVSSYSTAKDGNSISYPNISFVEEDSSVRYINKPSWITITYDVTDTSDGVYLFEAPAEDTSSVAAVAVNTGSNYWSSSEYSASNVRDLSAGDGEVDSVAKAGNNYVRAFIRL